MPISQLSPGQRYWERDLACANFVKDNPNKFSQSSGKSPASSHSFTLAIFLPEPQILHASSEDPRAPRTTGIEMIFPFRSSLVPSSSNTSSMHPKWNHFEQPLQYRWTSFQGM